MLKGLGIQWSDLSIRKIFLICNGMMHKAKFELEYLFLKNFRIALRQDVREAQIKYWHTAETSDCCESKLTI